MFVTELSLADFRSYQLAEIPLDLGVTVFTGANGQGKTNLVEAVEYLATLGSHRASSEAPLVRFGAERALLRARVQAGPEDPRQLLLEIQITPGRANKASLNRSTLKRARDLLGALRVVVFAPDDLAIVKQDPAQRRRFIDELITTRWPRLAGVRADYDRVLRQRSTLLKSLSGRGSGRPPDEANSTLDVWDESLAQFGSELVEARVATLSDLGPQIAQAYAGIAPTRNQAAAVYSSAIGAEPGLSRAELAGRMMAQMRERRRDEISRGVCLVGPHRDEIILQIGGLPARGYASHGESWSLALALRLASFELLRGDGVEPVLVLDDVFAELDEVRRARLAATASTAQQVLITAAVTADIPAGLRGRHYQVTMAEAPVDQGDGSLDSPQQTNLLGGSSSVQAVTGDDEV